MDNPVRFLLPVEVINSLCILKDNLKNQESIKICALIRGYEYELSGQEYKIGDKSGIYVSWDGEE